MRVYLKEQDYPLLNPRLVQDSPSQGHVEVNIIGTVAPLEDALRSFKGTAQCRFVPRLRLVKKDYLIHGHFVIPFHVAPNGTLPESEFAALSGAFNVIHAFLAPKT